MSKRPWYKRYPSDFLAGTMELSCEEKGAYTVVLDLMYDRGGPIPDDAQWIARVCNCSTRRWKLMRSRLIKLGKLSVDGNLLNNKRVLSEINVGKLRHENAVKDGSRGGVASAKLRASSRDNKELASKTLQEKSNHTRATQRPEARGHKEEEEPPPSPSKAMIETWNKICVEAGLPKVLKLPTGRNRKLQSRFADDFDSDLGQWEAYCLRIAGSTFLCGKNDHSSGWKADIDWVLEPRNLAKIVEGKYDEDDPPEPRADGEYIDGPYPTIEERGLHRDHNHLWYFMTSGYWNPMWGEAPGQPNCDIDPMVMARFGPGGPEEIQNDPSLKRHPCAPDLVQKG